MPDKLEIASQEFPITPAPPTEPEMPMVLGGPPNIKGGVYGGEVLAEGLIDSRGGLSFGSGGNEGGEELVK